VCGCGEIVGLRAVGSLDATNGDRRARQTVHLSLAISFGSQALLVRASITTRLRQKLHVTLNIRYGCMGFAHKVGPCRTFIAY